MITLERARESLAQVRSSRTSSWWLTFFLLGVMGACWALASPPAAAPDELSHVINATAVARGELVGNSPTANQARSFRQHGTAAGAGKLSAYRSVRVPEIYGNPNTACFTYNPDANAACLHFEGSERTASVLTPVSWYPPAYYALVGFVARPFPAGPFAVYVMRFTTVALMAALLASAVASIQCTGNTRIRFLGFLTALTPMVLFLNASVNPSGPEIAAGVALWASGLVLVDQGLGGPVDERVVLRAGVAATVLTLSRQDGPLWLTLIVVMLAFVAGRRGLSSIWRSPQLKLCTTAVALCTGAQIAWVLAVGTFSSDHSVFTPEQLARSAGLRSAIGNSSGWYHQMVGYFGWLDTPSPALTLVIWTFVLGGLVLLAIGLGRRRWAAGAVAVVIVTIVTPIVVDFAQSQGTGTGHWQGRYALPFAVGAPLLAAFALERDDVAERVAASLLPVTTAMALALAHLASFAQNLRRYMVGYNGRVWFFIDPAWSPPVEAGLLVLTFGSAVALTFAWLLADDGPRLTGGAVASEQILATRD